MSALFFGEDIFIAIGSILLMKGVLEGYGIVDRAAASVGLGDPDRDRGVRDPRRAPAGGSTGGWRGMRGRDRL